MPIDVCAFELYFLFLLNQKPNLVSEEVESTLLEFVTAETPNVVEKIESVVSGEKVAAFISDEILKTRNPTGKSEMDSFFYRIYPNLSHLEVNIENYANVGLAIALVTLFGGIGCCYFVTRALGGNLKRDKFG